MVTLQEKILFTGWPASEMRGTCRSIAARNDLPPSAST
jgi:hypothetical protein